MRILTYQQLKLTKGIPFSRVHLRRLMDAGKFPKSIPVGANTIGWVETEVDAWLKSKIDKRDLAA